MPAEEPERVAFAADFRVGDWLLEPSLDRLSRNGTVVRLRPQLTNLLVFLASRAGRTVSKEEILQKVWAGQFVAESGMTRCIAEIRQALEDDAHEPRIIETIPKRGYRLVAPVVFLDTSEPPAPKTSPAADGEAMAASPAPEVEPAAASSPNRVRRLAHPSAIAGTLVAAAVLATTWGAANSRAPVLKERESVLLADVTNTTGDAAFDHTLRLALGVQLGQAPFLRFLSQQQVRRALTLMGRAPEQPVVGALALEVCQREGAAALLAGSIARLGTHYAVGIEAIACRTGESIGRELVEVDSKDEVLTALGTAAKRVRATLGESRASLSQYDVPIVRATTPSLEALKALSLGDLSRDHARLPEALRYYRQATELDPGFAVAWARRGAAARNMGESAADPRFGGDDEPLYSFRKAYELRDRVSEPERFYILGHYYRFVAGDPYKAVETYKTWRQTYPGDDQPTTNLASLYVNVFGQYDTALPEAQHAVRLAPYSSIANSTLAASYLGMGKLAEARQALRESAERGAGDLAWHMVAYEVAALDGDAAAMRGYERWAADDATAALVMTHLAANAAAASGRLRDARRAWSEDPTSITITAPRALRSALRLWQAETEALLGDARAARAAAEAALVMEHEAGDVLVAAIGIALSGDPVRASALIDEAARRARPGICATYVWRPIARALVEAAAGRREQALEILREVAPFERGREFGLMPLGVRGMLELSAGRSQEAARTFDTLLRLRAVAATSPWVPFARLGLARARRDGGDVAGARAAYQAFIDAMKNADADARLLVAARRELAALAGK